NHADYHGHAAPLLEDVATEAGQVLDPEAKVKLVFGFEPLLLILGQDRVGQLEGVLGREDLGCGAVGHVPINPQLRPLAGGDVEIRRLLLDHFLEQRAQIDGHPALSLTTSSRVVTPRSSFFIPSMRRVSIPSATAWSRSSATDAPRKIMRRSSGDSAMTSYRPWRPLYPVPLQLSQPRPFMKLILRRESRSVPREGNSSWRWVCGPLHSLQMRRTSRWATTRLTALATLNASMPISIMRVMVEGASLVCSVESTRWPVSAALMAMPPVSMSRISPTMMMFGSCRRNAFSAAAKVMPISLRTSTWLTPARLYSTGSSAVMMFTSIVLTRESAEYSVVVLPEPVGPVTSTMPYGLFTFRIKSCSALTSKPNLVRSSVRLPLSRI